MLAIILHPLPLYITLLLLMRGTTQQPQRLPANAPQNPYTYSLNSPLSMHPNFHSLGSVNNQTSNQNTYPNNGRPNRELVEQLDISDNQSFARNFKGRLYGFDANQDAAKQEKMKNYREQLLQQAQQARIRKLQQKRKQEAEDMKREKQYNESIKIQAQKKAVKKDEHSYFMMRTSRGKVNNIGNSRANKVEPTVNNYLDDGRNKLAEEFNKKDNLKRTMYDPPKIIKRGGYHNQSSLDKSKPNPEQEVEQPESPKQEQQKQYKRQEKQERQGRMQVDSQHEQQLHRISEIMLFQNNMLRKLDNFKKEIIQASKSFKLDDELQKVKLKLRAKPLNLAKIYSLNTRDGVDNLLERSSFYHLPLINTKGKIYEGSREARRRDPVERLAQSQLLHQPQPEQKKQVIKLQDKRIGMSDDKNYFDPPEEPQNTDFAIQAGND